MPKEKRKTSIKMDISSALSLVGLDDLYEKKFSEEQVDILALSMMTESDFRDLEVLEEHVPLLINLSADIKASLGSNASASLEGNSRKWHEHRNTSEQHLIGVEAFVSSCNMSALNSLLVIIMRGIPGAGKSTLTRRLRETAEAVGREVVVCSADDYFLDNRGVYRFNPSKIGDAHKSCKWRFDTAITPKWRRRNDRTIQLPKGKGRGRGQASDESMSLKFSAPPQQDSRAPVIIVDNTNTQLWEYQAYIEAAIAVSGTRLLIAEIELPSDSSIDEPYQAQLSSQPSSSALRVCAERNSHRVPLEVIEKMAARWEKDDRAFKIPAGGFSWSVEGQRRAS